MKPLLFITAQRLNILNLVKDRKRLRISDLYDLIPRAGGTEESHKRNVRFITNKMVKLGLLNRESVAVRSKFYPGTFIQANEQSFSLGPKAKVVFSKVNVSETEEPTNILHEHAITDIHTALEKSLPPGYKLYWRQDNLKKTVNPDALFCIVYPDGTARYFFLEVERRRQSLSKATRGVLSKLKRYDHYRKAGDYSEYSITQDGKKQWVFKNFRVLITTPKSDRQPLSVRDHFLDRASKSFPFSWIWVSRTSDMIDDPTGQIFFSPKDHKQTKHSILEA